MSWVDLPQILRVILALIFIVSLMGGLSYILRRFGFTGEGMITTGQKRLSVQESLPLDARRRMVILCCDEIEYVVLFGANGETLLETRQKDKTSAAKSKKETKTT